MSAVSNVRLALFLSHGGSLRKWHRDGILDREMMLYLGLLKAGALREILVFSYDATDSGLASRRAQSHPEYLKVQFLNPWFETRHSALLYFIWSIAGPIFYRGELKQCDILKCNQVSGSWATVLAFLLTGVPMIFRSGYSLSRRFRKNGHYVRMMVAYCAERLAAWLAARVFVTSKTQQALMATRGFEAKTILRPPPIDTGLFKPIEELNFNQPILTVARLTPQKNLEQLILACAQIGRQLVIIGTGPLHSELRDLAKNQGGDVIFLASIGNNELAEKYRDHSIFILPSLHEGLPKTVLEAMASGLICAGSNIPGVIDLIQHQETGYLIDGCKADDIASTLRQILSEQKSSVGENARLSVERDYSLDAAISREASAYADML